MRLALATGVVLTSPALTWAQSSPTQGNPIDTLPKVDTCLLYTSDAADDLYTV